MASPTIALCMIVKDEEETISQAIESVKAIVDEIIVVDTGSKDKTKGLAKGFGAMVIDEKWEEDFSKARNISIKQAKSDWILVLDADETISESDHSSILKLIKGEDPSKAVGFMLKQRNYLNSSTTDRFKESKGDSYKESKPYKGWHETGLIRIFANNDHIRFSGAVHESVKPSIIENNGKIHMIEIPIHHFGKVMSDTAKKGAGYEKIGKRKAMEHGDFKSYFELGVQQLVNNKYDDAIVSLTQAREMNPTHARTYLNLGTAYIRNGLPDEAINVLLSGLKVKEHPDLYNNLGVAYENSGKIGLAFDSYKKSTFLEENVDAYQNIVRLCVQLEKYDDAIRVLGRIIKMDSRNTTAINNLAGLNLQTGNIDEAIKLFTDSLKITEHALTYEGLAMAYNQAGDLPSARKALKDAINAGHPQSEAFAKELERLPKE
jgi:glycosyltransferase involved in cell wall biosynthesis